MVTVEGVSDEAVRFISGPCELLRETTGLVVATDIYAPISAVDVKSDVRLSEGDGTVVVVATDTDSSISVMDAKSKDTAKLSEVDNTVTEVDTDSEA